MYRMYLSAKRDGIDYNLAYIPENFEEKPGEIFDPLYMGTNCSMSDTSWRNRDIPGTRHRPDSGSLRRAVEMPV
jgi:hypothetical protein